jgi:hypothetical protein
MTVVTPYRRGMKRARGRNLYRINNFDASRERGNGKRIEGWKCQIDRLPTQPELEDGMLRPGGVRVIERREAYELRAELQRVTAAVRAIPQSWSRLHRPVDSPSARDTEAGQ